MSVPLPRRTLTPLLQPDETPYCGQTAVAMVAGCSIDDAVWAMRRVGDSANEEMVAGLKRLGVKVGRIIPAARNIKKKKGRRKVGSTEELRVLPDFCIGFVSDDSGWSHAVVILDGLVYDPGIGWPVPLRVYEDFIIDRAYSRRYSKKAARKFRKRNQVAYWEGFLPILSEPPGQKPLSALL